MEEAIKLAIEGGWLNPKDKSIVEVRLSKLEKEEYVIRTVGENFIINKYHIFLDPLFWQSLGKALGWSDEYHSGEKGISYRYYWHEFIDHLAEGKDADSFFKELLTKY